MPYAPQEQFTVAGNYIIPLPTGAIDSNVTVNHSAGYFPEPDNVITQPRYTKVNASTEWKSASGQYALQLWGRNLTNDRTFAFATTIGSGLHEATYDPPRTYGIMVG